MSTEELGKRVEALELNKNFHATKAAVQKVEMEMLSKLRDIRATMLISSQNNNVTSSKELEALKMENQKLKAQNTKQAYRVEHLVRSVQELQTKLGQTQQQ